ncbi:hypothetical protein DI005_25425 [Prauserella sp. PE36]|nr:hypothetical protein DI005_25425 [Prauserella sp. PE36]
MDEEFWEGCRQGRYLLFRCTTCDHAVWPAGGCPRHGLAPMVWKEATGQGRLHSWTVVHQRYANSFADPPPNVAVVELDEGPLVHSTVLGAARLELGMRLEVFFEDIGQGVVLPVFRPTAQEGESTGPG